MEELSGIVDKVIHRNGNGFIVLSVMNEQGSFVVTGEDAEIHEGDVVQCKGGWTVYNLQNQFRAKSIIPQIPVTTDAILSYLSAGRIRGISKELASRVVAEFGEKTLEVIEQNPHLLKKVKGFGQSRIQALTQGLKDQIGFRSLLIFLHGFGLSKRHINKIAQHYGIQAVEQIKQNPYCLCEDVAGIGFKIADRIALKSGIAADDPNRVIAGVVHCLNTSIYVNGDTGMTRPALIKDAFNLLNAEGMVDRDIVEEAVSQITSSSLAHVMEIDGDAVIFPAIMYRAENGIAAQLARLICQFRGVAHRDIDHLISNAEEALQIQLAVQQREAVSQSISEAVSIITGGPGTGKTTIIKALLHCLKQGFGYSQEEILLCAPTGKAAKRLSQASGMQAFTIHRALSYSPDKDGFLFDRSNPLHAKVIVIDEASMVDTLLMFWLIQAVDVNTQVILLGDVDQLPSVGPGKVLKDLIDCGKIPFTRLTEIYRQGADSHIIINAHRVNSGEMPEIANSQSKDFWFVRTQSDAQLASETQSLIHRMATHFGLDPMRDIQVLTAMRKGTVGQIQLNALLQSDLNGKAGPGLKVRQDDVDVEFKIGDKVMHIQNNRELQVFNGDTGVVHSVNVKGKTLVVDYEGRLVEYAFADLDQLRLSYAMTIHKSQGSEYPCIIVVVSNSHYTMLNRNLYYTAITRGKSYCVMVGDTNAMRVAVSRVSSDKRITGLIQHILSRM